MTELTPGFDKIAKTDNIRTQLPSLRMTEEIEKLSSKLRPPQIQALKKILTCDDYLPETQDKYAEYLGIHKATWFRWLHEQAFITAKIEILRLRRRLIIADKVENVILREVVANGRELALAAEITGLRERPDIRGHSGNNKQIDYGDTG